MTLPSTNLSASLINTEVTYRDQREIQFSKHWVNVVEGESSNQVTTTNLRTRKAAVNINLPGAVGNGTSSSTPVLNILNLFPYMINDDWFSVDVAFTVSPWINARVFRCFFKYNSNGLSGAQSQLKPIVTRNWDDDYTSFSPDENTGRISNKGPIYDGMGPIEPSLPDPYTGGYAPGSKIFVRDPNSEDGFYNAYVLTEVVKNIVEVSGGDDRFGNEGGQLGFFESNRNGNQYYEWWGNGDRSDSHKNYKCKVFYNPDQKTVWAWGNYDGRSTNSPNCQVILRRIIYWPEYTTTKDQKFPLYNPNGYYTGIDVRIIDAHRDILHREPDEFSAKYYQGRLAQGVTINQIRAEMAQTSEALADPVLNTQHVLRVKMAQTYEEYNALYPVGDAVYVPSDPNEGQGGDSNEPGSGGGSGSGGGDCFTAESLVLIPSSSKKISDIKIGDFVYSKDRKTMNKVMFIECVKDTHHEALYSPTEDMEPFATINHPLYIDGELTAVDNSICKIKYPWLNIKKTIVPPKMCSPKGKLVYNLWVDGDGTYIVNGYATTSIIGDGGATRLFVEQGYFTYEQAINNIKEFTSYSPDLLLGVYHMNKLVGKLNWKPVNKYFGTRLRDDSYPKSKKTIYTIFTVIGKIIRIFK
jgi:hypothetical protein